MKDICSFASHRLIKGRLRRYTIYSQRCHAGRRPGIQGLRYYWIPAFAGMTQRLCTDFRRKVPVCCDFCFCRSGRSRTRSGIQRYAALSGTWIRRRGSPATRTGTITRTSQTPVFEREWGGHPGGSHTWAQLEALFAPLRGPCPIFIRATLR